MGQRPAKEPLIAVYAPEWPHENQRKGLFQASPLGTPNADTPATWATDRHRLLAWSRLMFEIAPLGLRLAG
jgi:hypothetical protein